ncbi:MAG: four helix bundle protein [Prevotella sp.]|nr:four helix bundle protein [Prevotella sp.]
MANIISVKTSAFTERIIKMCQYLQDEKIEGKDINGKIMLSQIFRSGTSIGANIAESKFAQSRPDFVSKLSIALKEANETECWLLNLYNAKYLTEEQYKSMFNDTDEIISILVKIIKTTKQNGV